MMKRIYTVLLAMALVVAIANTGKSQGFQLGLKLLGNATSLNGFDKNISAQDLKGKLTFGAGLFATIKFSKLGVQPEVLYMRQGAKFTYTDATLGDLKFNQKMTYLTIPVMINFYLVKFVHIEVGPYFGILLDANQDLSGSLGTSSLVGLGGNNKDSFKSSDFGAAFGVGLDVKKLNLSLRYMLGLSDVNNITGATETVKNGIFQFGIGISLVNKGA